MTIIVGVVKGSTVTMGGDSRFTSNSAIHPMATEKIWRQGPFIFGITGCMREGQIVRYAKQLPAPDDGDLTAWLSTKFIDVVRDARKESGFDEKKTDGTEVGPRIMVGVRGRLFVIYEDYTVAEYLGSAAIGSGMDFAMGSLHTTGTMRMSGPRRVTVALGAACAHNAYCAPPFTILRGRR